MTTCSVGGRVTLWCSTVVHVEALQLTSLGSIPSIFASQKQKKKNVFQPRVDKNKQSSWLKV